MSKDLNKRWTKEETEILRQTKDKSIKYIQENLLPNRSLKAIQQKRFVLRVGNPRAVFTLEEDLFLEDCSGVIPLPLIVKKINEKFGVLRTCHSVRTRMFDLGLSLKMEWDNLPMYKWQTIFKLTQQDFINWQKERLISPKKIGKFKIVSVKQMEKVINKYPDAFANSDEQLLLCYFGEEIYQKIIELKKQGLKRPSSKECCKPVKIKCVKTGLIFNSMTEAATYFNCTVSNIYQKTKRGKFIKL